MPLLPSRPSPLRPHPLCPDCGYDVADQVERGRLRCPECGAQFDRDEVRWQRRPDDWSPLHGFLRVGVLLGLRSLAFVPVWAGLLWLAGPWIAFRWFTSLFVLAILGLVVGLVYGRGVDERAGFVSGVLTAFASLCCLVALAVGATIASALGRMPAEAVSMAIGAPWMAATVIIIRITMLDD